MTHIEHIFTLERALTRASDRTGVCAVATAIRKLLACKNESSEIAVDEGIESICLNGSLVNACHFLSQRIHARYLIIDPMCPIVPEPREINRANEISLNALLAMQAQGDKGRK
jgi:hypothetical protein